MTDDVVFPETAVTEEPAYIPPDPPAMAEERGEADQPAPEAATQPAMSEPAIELVSAPPQQEPGGNAAERGWYSPRLSASQPTVQGNRIVVGVIGFSDDPDSRAIGKQVNGAFHFIEQRSHSPQQTGRPNGGPFDARCGSHPFVAKPEQKLDASTLSQPTVVLTEYG